ncbi:MAG TPA: hypothetical protein VFD82_01800 [Planctomycetota bacterium]|nr:hypothetical protein [Planctomycetota bacterium]
MLLAAAPAAQEPEAKPAGAPTVVRPTQPATVTLGQPFSLPPGDHDLVDLVEKAATILGRNLLWQEGERQIAKGGQSLTVTLNNPVKLTPTQFEELLANLLYSRGFAIVPVDAEKGFHEVLCLYGARGREVMNRATWRTPEEVMARPNHCEFVLTSVRLKHINATICTNALRPFFAVSGGNNIGQLVIGNVGNQEAMVLAGFTDQLCAALRLIRECDQPQTQPPDLNMPGAPNPYPQIQAQIKALQDQVAELQKAIGQKK